MTVGKIEIMAARNLPRPDGLLPPELYLYLSLRALYQSYRVKAVTKEQAKAEKAEIISQYNELDLWHRIYVQQSRTLRCVQMHSDRITHSGCEVCRGLMDALSGINTEEVNP